MVGSDREEAIRLMLAAKVQHGSANLSYGMSPYAYTRSKSTGSYVINLGMTWEKIKLAARMVFAVKEPRDVLAISAKPFGQRAVHKFSQFLGALCINSRFTPGFFTNHSIKGKFLEPRLIIVCDPNTDKQAIREASYANIPCIALCDTDANIQYVDCVIPCSTKNKTSIGLVMWLLTREVLRLRGDLLRAQDWRVLADLFFYRDQQDEDKIQADMTKGTGDAGPQEAAESAAGPVAGIQASDGQPAGEEWVREGSWGI